MIDPTEFSELKEDLSEINLDWDVMLQMLVLIELKKLNLHLSHIDSDLMEIVRK
jgi:hypothetical protein